MLRLKRRETADAAADHAAEALGICDRRGDARILHREPRRAHGELREAVRAPHILGCAKNFTGSNPRTSPAILQSNAAVSNCVIGPMPLTPFVMLLQKVWMSFPTGVRTPIPVMTTRRCWLIRLLSKGRALSARRRCVANGKCPHAAAMFFKLVGGRMPVIRGHRFARSWGMKNRADGRQQLQGGARDSRAVSGDPPETPRNSQLQAEPPGIFQTPRRGGMERGSQSSFDAFLCLPPQSSSAPLRFKRASKSER